MLTRLLAVLILVAAGTPALADDVPLPPLTPKGEYLVMTRDDAASSSTCIGDPATPMCAVETVMGCWLRGEIDLCRIGMGLGRDPALDVGFPERLWLYRVVRREVLTDRRFPWHPKRDLPERPGEIEMQAGDIRIDILKRQCRSVISSTTCHRVWDRPPIAYIVRRQGDGWAVITWGPAFDPRDIRGP